MPTQFIDQTPRDFLASLTPPLAIPNTRGRFSKEGQAALDTARADGFLFIGDPGHPKTEVKAKREPKAAAPKPVVVKGAKAEGSTVPAQPKAPAVEVDAKEVRAWAKQNGHEVGDRGRIHAKVVEAFLAAGGKAVGKGAKPVQAVAKEVKVRKQTVAYGRIPRRKGDPKYLSEPIIGVQQCGKCRKGISYCPCEAGPSLPKQFGGGPTVFSLAQVPALAQAVTEVTA